MWILSSQKRKIEEKLEEVNIDRQNTYNLFVVENVLYQQCLQYDEVVDEYVKERYKKAWELRRTKVNYWLMCTSLYDKILSIANYDYAGLKDDAIYVINSQFYEKYIEYYAIYQEIIRCLTAEKSFTDLDIKSFYTIIREIDLLNKSLGPKKREFVFASLVDVNEEEIEEFSSANEITQVALKEQWPWEKYASYCYEFLIRKLNEERKQKEDKELSLIRK